MEFKFFYKYLYLQKKNFNTFNTGRESFSTTIINKYKLFLMIMFLFIFSYIRVNTYN